MTKLDMNASSHVFFYYARFSLPLCWLRRRIELIKERAHCRIPALNRKVLEQQPLHAIPLNHLRVVLGLETAPCALRAVVGLAHLLTSSAFGGTSTVFHNCSSRSATRA